MMRFVLFSLAVFVLAGCATHAPTADFKKQIADSDRLCAADAMAVNLSTTTETKLNDITAQRLKSALENKIAEKQKSTPCPIGVKRDYALAAKISNYDEGNKFGRFMLAGLGSMNISGEFILINSSNPAEPKAEFSVSKTFAWGGAYGAATGIEDIEPAFAEAVANSIVVKTEGKD